MISGYRASGWASKPAGSVTQADTLTGLPQNLLRRGEVMLTYLENSVSGSGAGNSGTASLSSSCTREPPFGDQCCSDGLEYRALGALRPFAPPKTVVTSAQP
jgi:hypothetical protein